MAVALLEADDVVDKVAERLEFHPFRHEDLLEDLGQAGLRCHSTTYAADADRYLVVAAAIDE